MKHDNKKDVRRIKLAIFGVWGFAAVWFVVVIGLLLTALYVVGHFVQKFW